MTVPRDWKASLIAGGMMFHPPEGPRLAGIRVIERVRPMVPMKDIVAASMPRIEEVVRDPQIGALEEVVTAEGEYGAMVTVSGVGKVDGVPLDAVVGAVYGDDFYDQIDAYLVDPAKNGRLTPAVRDFLYDHSLGLGTDRQRRFMYDPPDGWIGIPRGMFTEWLHPEFPKHYSRINVAAAMPEKDVPASEIAISMLYRKAGRFKKTAQLEQSNVSSEFGVHGLLYRIRGRFDDPDQPETDLLGCVLRDERYMYTMRLETVRDNVDEDREVLNRMVKSIRPIPRPVTRESDVFTHWSE